MLFCLMVSHKSLRLPSFFFILFTFCSLSLVILNVLSLRLLILSIAWSGLLLCPSSDFFQFSYCNFQPQNFCLVFLHDFCIFDILILLMYPFLYFIWLSVLSFHSLSILMVVILNSLVINTFLFHFLEIYYVSLIEPCFSCYLLWDLGIWKINHFSQSLWSGFIQWSFHQTSCLGILSIS